MKSLRQQLCTILICLLGMGIAVPSSADDMPITIAILAKDKAHTLPLFLACIEAQTWPKNKTYIYIRTNNNTDDTVAVLHAWVNKMQSQYLDIFIDDSDIGEKIEHYGQHEWNSTRFKILGKIRQDSIAWALEHNSHYFVVDCDNFIKPTTLEMLHATQLPIVAPLLRPVDASRYANFHAAVDSNGYYAEHAYYDRIAFGAIKGIIEVPVVHCAYFIHRDVLDTMLYDDNSYRYEYVIFSDNARRKGIPQYLDTRQQYGRITFATTSEELLAEPWIQEFATISEQRHDEQILSSSHTMITIAMLIGNQNYFLPLYLACIEQQTWPKNKTYLYIKTYNNNDNTIDILTAWLHHIGKDYAGVYFDTSSVPPCIKQSVALNYIRQESVIWATMRGASYCVVSANTFLYPDALKFLASLNLPLVAPLLRLGDQSPDAHSHASGVQEGYFTESELYKPILDGTLQGYIQVPRVYDTYLIRHDMVPKILYDDGSERCGHAILSDYATKNNMPQFLYNTYLCGRLSYASNEQEFLAEPWIQEMQTALQESSMQPTNSR